MKKYTLITALLVGFISSALSKDLWVDGNLAVPNDTTTFNTLSRAIQKSADGDVIIVKNDVQYTSSSTITKSITIMPSSDSIRIKLNADLIITGKAGLNVAIVGIDFGNYGITSNGSGTASTSNRAKVYTANCLMGYLTIAHDFFNLIAYNNSLSGSLNFKFGTVVYNNLKDVDVDDETATNTNDGVIKFIANTLTGSYFKFRNDNNEFLIANNKFSFSNNRGSDFDCSGAYYYGSRCSFQIFKYSTTSSIINKIWNNDFSTSLSYLIFEFPDGSSIPRYNLEIVNNYFANTPYNQCSGRNWGSEPWNRIGGTTVVPNYGVPGKFVWAYNGIGLSGTYPPPPTPTLDFYQEVGVTTTKTNTGHPSSNYNDPDGSRNDRGSNGGPYSYSNYANAAGTNKLAAIIDLDVKASYQPNEKVKIKGTAGHISQ